MHLEYFVGFMLTVAQVGLVNQTDNETTLLLSGGPKKWASVRSRKSTWEQNKKGLIKTAQ